MDPSHRPPDDLCVGWNIYRRTGLLPDQLNAIGTITGFVLSAAFPRLIGATTWTTGLGWSVLGAVVGFTHGLAMAAITKAIFGRKSLEFSHPTPLQILCHADSAQVRLGSKFIPLEDLFTKMSDVALARASSISVVTDQMPYFYQETELKIYYGWIEVDGARHEINPQTHIEAVVHSLTYRRDAIGMGFVKFLAIPGAFLGWMGAIATFWGTAVLRLVGLGLPGLPAADSLSLEPAARSFDRVSCLDRVAHVALTPRLNWNAMTESLDHSADSGAKAAAPASTSASVPSIALPAPSPATAGERNLLQR